MKKFYNNMLTSQFDNKMRFGYWTICLSRIIKHLVCYLSHTMRRRIISYSFHTDIPSIQYARNSFRLHLLNDQPSRQQHAYYDEHCVSVRFKLHLR